MNAMFGHVEADEANKLIRSIAPGVMKCLVRSGFFQKLDDIIYPKDDLHSRRTCGGDYKLSESILLKSGFERKDLDDIWLC